MTSATIKACQSDEQWFFNNPTRRIRLRYRLDGENNADNAVLVWRAHENEYRKLPLTVTPVAEWYPYLNGAPHPTTNCESC